MMKNKITTVSVSAITFFAFAIGSLQQATTSDTSTQEVQLGSGELELFNGLSKDITDTQQYGTNIGTSTTAALSKIEELKESLKKVLAAKNAAESSVRAKEEALKEAENKNSQLSTEIEELKQKSEQTIEQFKSDKDKLDQELEKNKQSLLQKQEEFDNNAKELEKLREELQKEQEKLAQSTKELEKLKEELAQKQKELETAKEESEDLRIKLQVAEEQLSMAKKQLSETEEKSISNAKLASEKEDQMRHLGRNSAQTVQAQMWYKKDRTRLRDAISALNRKMQSTSESIGAAILNIRNELTSGKDNIVKYVSLRLDSLEKDFSLQKQYISDVATELEKTKEYTPVELQKLLKKEKEEKTGQPKKVEEGKKKNVEEEKRKDMALNVISRMNPSLSSTTPSS